MTRKFVILLVISFIYGQTNAFINFSDITTLIEWGDKVWRNGEKYYNEGQSLSSNDTEKINQLLRKLSETFSELKAISKIIEVKFEDLSMEVPRTIYDSISFQLISDVLIDPINIVNRFYEDGTDYTSNNMTFSLDTLNNFANLVLSQSDNIPAALQIIYHLIINIDIAEYMPLLLNDAKNLFIECDRTESAQQNMYYTYIILLITEMKGLSILSQVYFIKQITNKNHNYTNELNFATDRYKSRIMSYNNVTLRYLPQFPRVIHSCSVNLAERDVHYIELLGFGSARIFDERSLLEDLPDLGQRCHQACDYITQDGPQILPNKHRIHHCEYLGPTVTVCPANPGSTREYLWWKNDLNTYGHGENGCDNKRELSSKSKTGIWAKIFRRQCMMCVCSMYVNDEKSNGTKWYINLHPQLSDITNNMVVTGVRFVKKGNTISLQIQQNKFSSGAMTNNTGQWLEPKEGIKSLVSYNRRSMYLDDIILLDNHVVTGVKLELADNPAGFQLQVHGNPFDFRTGELNPLFGGWFGPERSRTMYLPSYDRKRIEIDMGNADDPARGSDFDYDADTNKFVKFKHTNIHKDAGQTTIPLIETLPAVSQKPIPLSGVGISYKGSHGFGGYIAPRIYTMDLPL